MRADRRMGETGDRDAVRLRSAVRSPGSAGGDLASGLRRLARRLDAVQERVERLDRQLACRRTFETQAAVVAFLAGLCARTRGVQRDAGAVMLRFAADHLVTVCGEGAGAGALVSAIRRRFRRMGRRPSAS